MDEREDILNPQPTVDDVFPHAPRAWRQGDAAKLAEDEGLAVSSEMWFQ